MKALFALKSSQDLVGARLRGTNSESKLSLFDERTSSILFFGFMALPFSPLSSLFPSESCGLSSYKPYFGLLTFSIRFPFWIFHRSATPYTHLKWNFRKFPPVFIFYGFERRWILGRGDCRTFIQIDNKGSDRFTRRNGLLMDPAQIFFISREAHKKIKIFRPWLRCLALFI